MATSYDQRPWRRKISAGDWAASAAPLGRRAAVPGLEVPVVARLRDETVGAEPYSVQAGDRRFSPVRLEEERPVLDRGDVALLDGLAEPDLGRLGLGDDPAHVAARVLELSKRMRAKDAVFGVERRGRLAVAAPPRPPIGLAPASR